MEQWQDYLAKDGEHGGQRALPVDFELQQQEMFEQAQQFGLKSFNEEIIDAIKEDVLSMRRLVRKCKRRRAVPLHEIPVEFYQILLMPNFRIGRSKGFLF